jgi:hypothetical protein
MEAIQLIYLVVISKCGCFTSYRIANSMFSQVLGMVLLILLSCTTAR